MKVRSLASRAQDFVFEIANPVGDSFLGPNLDQDLSKSFCLFSVTTPWRVLYDRRDQAVPCSVHAKFAREYLEDRTNHPPHHIIYRRNYFAISVDYTLAPPTGSAKGNLFVCDDNTRHRVRALGIRVRAAKNHEHGEDVAVSVFTAKRGPPINPAPPLEQKMQPNVPGNSSVYAESTGHGSDALHRPIYHTFPRLQFRKATDNNGMRRKGQSFFRVVVELRALIMRGSGEEEWVQIASTVSGPLLVRGRCPNSFEPYDPKNRKRKPPRDQSQRPHVKGARPTGIFTIKRASKIAARQRQRRIPSLTVSDTMSDSISGYATPMTTESTVLSAPESPVMVPRKEIPPNLRLPILNEKRGASTFLKSEDHSSEDDRTIMFSKKFDAPHPCREMTTRAEDLQRHRVAAQLDLHSFDFTSPDYANLTPRSTPAMQEHVNTAITWELADHFY